MRIADVETIVVGTPPPHNGGTFWVFVRATTDSGVTGLGEVYGVPFRPPVIVQMVDDVAERSMLGADPFEIERLWRVVYSRGYTQRPDTSVVAVLSGLETACWDIIGKETGQPLYNLLGGRVREAIRAYTVHLPGARGRRVRVPRSRSRRRKSRPLPQPGLHSAQVRPACELLGPRPETAVGSNRGSRQALRGSTSTMRSAIPLTCSSARTGR